MQFAFSQSVLVRSVSAAVLSLSMFSLAQAANAVIPASAQLKMNNDAKTLSYQLSYDLGSPAATSNKRAVYIDVDKSATTGLRLLGAGADYVVINEILYRYSGVNGAWGWTEVKKVSFTDDGKKATWTIAKSDLLTPSQSLPTGAQVIGALANGVVYTSKLEQVLGADPILARDPLKWPFASNSIWNTPIGSGAQYVHAHLPEVPSNDEWAMMVNKDLDRIIFKPNAPITTIKVSDAGWDENRNRCAPTGGVLANVPIPANFVVPNSRNNNAAAILAADGRTIIQTQPFTRCVAGGEATSWGAFLPVDLYGSGITGAHGGSGLSSVGGTIRLGELRPLSNTTNLYQGMRHALKLNVDSREVLYKCQTKAECSRWPAVSADNAAVGYYGSKPGAHVPSFAMRMGALLALPADLDLTSLNLETDAAKQIAWTLQNYGTYIVDSTGGPGYDLSVEDGADGAFAEQFKQDWGFDFDQRVRDNTPWVRDLRRLISRLHVVDNNSPTSVGGGGTPRQALAPELPSFN